MLPRPPTVRSVVDLRWVQASSPKPCWLGRRTRGSPTRTGWALRRSDRPRQGLPCRARSMTPAPTARRRRASGGRFPVPAPWRWRCCRSWPAGAGERAAQRHNQILVAVEEPRGVGNERTAADRLFDAGIDAAVALGFEARIVGVRDLESSRRLDAGPRARAKFRPVARFGVVEEPGGRDFRIQRPHGVVGKGGPRPRASSSALRLMHRGGRPASETRAGPARAGSMKAESHRVMGTG